LPARQYYTSSPTHGSGKAYTPDLWLNNLLIMIGVIVSAIVMTLLISVIGHLQSH
jgi:hypothetical protein